MQRLSFLQGSLANAMANFGPILAISGGNLVWICAVPKVPSMSSYLAFYLDIILIYPNFYQDKILINLDKVNFLKYLDKENFLK